MADAQYLTFKIDCEWLCNFVRQRVYHEGVAFTEGLELIKASFPALSDSEAMGILTGTLKIVGINSGELVEDDKEQAYLDYVAREEKRKLHDAIQLDIQVHPLNYIDKFATCWSWKYFEVKAKEYGEFVNVYELSDWLQQPPVDNDMLFEGGMYPITREMHNFVIQTEDDKKKFYAELYDYWNGQLERKDLFAEDRKKIRLRQRSYEMWRDKDIERAKRLHAAYKEEIENKMRAKRAEAEKPSNDDKPFWVIREDGTYDLFEAREAFYLRNAKFVPCKEGVFHRGGLVAPNGDFYACTFASHERAAIQLCKQLGYFKTEDGFVSMEDEDRAKDLLYERGWVYVNSGGIGIRTFMSKYDEIEDMPQCQMNTCYDFILWEREQRDKG